MRTSLNQVDTLYESPSAYLSLPAPSALDLEVERVVGEALCGGVEALRALVAEATANNTRLAYTIASGRIQRLAYQGRDRKRLRLAIETYLAFVDLETEDRRDVILALHDFSADLVDLGADSRHVLRRLVATALDPERKRTVEEQLERPSPPVG